MIAGASGHWLGETLSIWGCKLLVTRFVHGFVHKTRRDGLRRGRRSGRIRTPAVRPPRSARQPETIRDGRDARRMAHNPAAQGTRRPTICRAVSVSLLANAFCGPEVTSTSRFVWEPGPLRASRRAACAHDFGQPAEHSREPAVVEHQGISKRRVVLLVDPGVLAHDVG